MTNWPKLPNKAHVVSSPVLGLYSIDRFDNNELNTKSLSTLITGE